MNAKLNSLVNTSLLARATYSLEEKVLKPKEWKKKIN